jgi:hypothetical protein
VNDSKVLKRSSLYNNTQYHGFNLEKGCQDGIPLYLFGDKGYPFLDWILTPHREGDQKPIQTKTKEGKVGGRKCFSDS